jgi:hypothetical protein
MGSGIGGIWLGLGWSWDGEEGGGSVEVGGRPVMVRVRVVRTNRTGPSC